MAHCVLCCPKGWLTKEDMYFWIDNCCVFFCFFGPAGDPLSPVMPCHVFAKCVDGLLQGQLIYKKKKRVIMSRPRGSYCEYVISGDEVNIVAGLGTNSSIRESKRKEEKNKDGLDTKKRTLFCEL